MISASHPEDKEREVRTGCSDAPSTSMTTVTVSSYIPQRQMSADSPACSDTSSAVASQTPFGETPDVCASPENFYGWTDGSGSSPEAPGHVLPLSGSPSAQQILLGL